MQNFFTRHFLVIAFIFLGTSSFAQNSILVNLGSATCSQPNAPVFSLISNPLSASPSVLTLCDLSNQLPDFFNSFIAYNPKDNKLYIDDIRSGDSSKVWVLDIGLPGNISCPSAIPLTPTYTYKYVPNNFEFDNNGNLWSFHDYNDTTGLCTMDNFDVTNGNVLFTKTLQFPLSNLPTTLTSGDVAILPNGRMFVVFGDDPSQLYEVLNYNGSVGDATAVYIATMPQNTFGIAYINGLLEITGTDEVSSCYYYIYDISNNTLSAQTNFQNGQSPIDNTSISPAIGSTKQLINTTLIDNNTADLTYEVYVRNMGNVMLNNINATDNLGTAFGAANVSNVSVSFEARGNDAGLTLNSSYNGTTDTSLLAPGQNLPNQILNNTNYFFKLQIKCRVSNLFYDLTYYNSAIGTATISNGSDMVNVSDSSNNGTSDDVDPNNNGNAGDPGENVPTPFYIPHSTSPVHFINVNATLINNSAIVNWTVATPTINADKFEVEYSTDGKNWNAIKQVNILSADQGNYQFTQENIPSGNIYYRIKEVDNNAVYMYSRVVLLNNKKGNSYVIFPNPANNYIEITAPYSITGNSSLELFDAIGRKLIENTINNSTAELNTSQLPNGNYMLRIKNNDAIITQKVLIIH